MKKLFSLFFSFLMGIAGLSAQTTDIGQPKSWSLKSVYKSIPNHNMPGFDLEARLQADAINEANKVGPWRFGYEFPVNFGLETGGVWTDLPNGDRIWQIAFYSDNALTMNLIFDRFALPQGASVFIYNQDRKNFIGAYTAANNNSEEMLGTSLLKGSSIIVEYYEPAAVSGQGRLNIGTVIHGYRSVTGYINDQLKGLNDSGNCNHDVNCPLGNGWQNEINSVALMMTGGSGFCTGALINNTASDGKPYFLTADHCLGGSPATWVFRFNWDSPNPICAQNQNSTDPGGPYNDVNGAVLRASDNGSDFGLLELNSTPTGDVFYAGWNRSSSPATEAVGIHHPSGDIKKICKENQNLAAANWGGAQTWEVADWDLGTTEPGSSGSPLFDANHRIIGQLFGGSAACSGLSNNGAPDYYGRFDVSWTGGGSSSSRLSNWLDPNNSNVMVLDGYDPNTPTAAYDAGLPQINNLSGSYCNQTTYSPEITLRNYGVNTLTSVTISYSVDGGAASTYNWTGNLTSGNSTVVTLPTFTISTSGNHSFSATVSSPNGQSDPTAANNTVSATFQAILNGESVDFDLLTDCWGSEISWDVSDSGGSIVASGGGYPDGNPTTYNEVLCLEAGCYTFSIYDSYGDGLEGSAYQSCGFDGNYIILSPDGDTLVNMSDPAFGSSSAHSFCVTSSSTAVYNSPNRVDNLQIFPNPSKGIFNIELKLVEVADLQLEVYNSMGQTVFSKTDNAANNYFYSLDLSDYSAGIYYVRIMAGEKMISRKIIKE